MQVAARAALAAQQAAAAQQVVPAREDSVQGSVYLDMLIQEVAKRDPDNYGICAWFESMHLHCPPAEGCMQTCVVLALWTVRADHFC